IGMFWRVCMILLVLLLASCSGPKEPLRIGLNAWPAYEFLYLAEQLGFYRDEGVKVKVVTFSSLADSQRAFERNQLDLMGSTLVEPLLVRETSAVAPVVIYALDYSNGGDMLLARKDIPDVASLRGKRLALEGRSGDILTAHFALASAGLGFKDVQVHDLPQANGVQAFLAGKIDAIQTYPPFAVELLNSGKAHALFDTRKAPGKVLDVLVATQDSVTQRSKELAGVLRALTRAMAYRQQHPDQADAIMAKREGLSVADFRSGMAGVQLLRPADQDVYLHQGRMQQALVDAYGVLQYLGQVRAKPACGRECVSHGPFLASRVQ
ncbi:MAG: ABC transporter substrate-binding protein, partial [Chitinivorax sp.]